MSSRSKATAELKERAKYLNSYEQICVAEVDAYNRENDEALTIKEARGLQKSGLIRGVLSYLSFDDYMDSVSPERVVKRKTREKQREVREAFQSLPLRERLKLHALSDVALVLKAHAQNLEQLEAELELEMEDENGMGDVLMIEQLRERTEYLLRRHRAVFHQNPSKKALMDHVKALQARADELESQNKTLREGMIKVNADAKEHERKMYLAMDKADACWSIIELFMAEVDLKELCSGSKGHFKGAYEAAENLRVSVAKSNT